MQCPNCREEIPNDSRFCNKCGKNIDDKLTEIQADIIKDAEEQQKESDLFKNPRSNSAVNENIKNLKANVAPKLKVNWVIYGGLILIIFLGIFIVQYNSPTEKIPRLFKSGAYDKAQNIYMLKIKDTADKQIIRQFLGDELNNTVDSFSQGIISYDQAVHLVDKIDAYSLIPKKISSAKSKIQNLKKSKEAYKTGKQYIQIGKINEGMDYLIQVDPADCNYQDAQPLIEKNLPDYKKAIIQKSEQLLVLKEYDKAIAPLELLNKAIDNDKDIKSEITKIKLAKIQAIEAGVVTSNYDDMNQMTSIVPSGYSTRYINTNNNINIYPQIMLSKNNIASLAIWVGFQQNDWIFFDKVIFNADGQLFTWSIDDQNKHTQVLWGGISEWTNESYVTADTKAFFIKEGIDSNHFNVDLISQMELLANAKTAKIRFSGQGYRDHIVTDKEKANLNTFIGLYQQYQDLNS